MLFCQKLCEQLPVLFISIQLSLPPSPLVVTGITNPHKLAEEHDGIFYFKYFNDFVLLPGPVTYSLFAPTPSAQYPFFNRSFSISSLATISRSLSNSERFLLTCNAANELPGCPFGINAVSPSAIFSFTHRQIILLSAVYSFFQCTYRNMLIQMLMDDLCFLLRCPYTLLLPLSQQYHLQLYFSIKEKVDDMVIFHVSTFILQLH